MAALAPASPLATRFSDTFGAPPASVPPSPTPLPVLANDTGSPQTPSPVAPPPADTGDNKIADLQKTFADIQEKTLKQMQGAETALNGIKIPELRMPPKPNVQQTNPAQAWGSTAMVFATLGSLLTRRPLTTAMNAMAGVLKGFREADQTAFDNSFKVWQAESQNALALGSFELQAYHAALSGVEERLAIGEKIGEAEQNAALAKIAATSSAFGDSQVQQIVSQYGLPGVVDMFAKRAQVLQQFDESTQKGIAFKLTTDAYKEWSASPEGMASSPQDKLDKWKMLENKFSVGGELSPDAIETAAEQLIAGDTSALANIGRGVQGAQNITAIKNRAAEILQGEGLSGTDLAQRVAEFQGTKAAERAVGTRSAQVSLATNEAIKMADLALDASRKVPRGQFVPINQAALAIQRGSSDPNLARFVAATNSFVNVYARAITPTGSPRVADKEHAYEMLNTAQSEEAYEAVIDQLKLEMQAAIEAPADSRKQLRSIGDDKPVGPELLKSKNIGAPAIGTIDSGFRFKGGDPADKANWEPVQ